MIVLTCRMRRISAEGKGQLSSPEAGNTVKLKNRKPEGGYRMKKNEQDQFPAVEDRRVPYCIFAPEWAEHARFDRQDEACNDGRAAVACGARGDEKPCPI